MRPRACLPPPAPRPSGSRLRVTGRRGRGSRSAGSGGRACGLPPGCLVVGLERAGREVLSEAGTLLLPGDHLTVVVADDEADKALVVVRLATGF
ncbi:MAG: TrkA C-terminal domain-containing protein [Phycisphaerae bacterium]